MDSEVDHPTAENQKTRPLSLFIIDNQPLYRQALRQALEKHLEIIGESELSPDVWSTIENFSPGIVLVDVGLPSLSGFAIARQIATRCPGVAVVILSPSPDDEQLFQAIKSGAVAFASKDISAEELILLLKQVARGAYPINETLLSQPTAAKKVLQLFKNLSLNGKDIEAFMTPLSPREREILGHISEGNPNKRIAATLGISQQIIKHYITSIMRKLNANDRTHAVVLAMRKGWLNIGEETESIEAKELKSFKLSGDLPDFFDELKFDI